MTTTTALADEFDALPLPSPKLLRRIGCDSKSVGHLVRVGRAVIERDRFQFHKSGRAVCVLPVCGEPDGAIESGDPAMTIRRGLLVDLLAFSPAEPDRWALRRGDANVLGAVELQHREAAPVRVHRTPFDWLRHGATGVVLLTREPALRRMVLAQVWHALIVADTAFGCELRSTIELTGARASILVDRSEGRAPA
jgi:hypothetical protein